MPTALNPSGLCGDRADRKHDPEERAAGRMVRGDDFAAVLGDDRLADRQADAHPGVLGGEEPIEHPRQVFVRNAGARVADGQRNVGRFGLDAQLDAAVRRARIGDGLDAVDPIMRLMEENPEFDFGCPGPFAHFVETFYKRGYEERLCQSVRRRPTPHTLWMLNRVINGTKGDCKAPYVSLLDEVLAHSDLDDQTLAQARYFRALHQ